MSNKAKNNSNSISSRTYVSCTWKDCSKQIRKDDLQNHIRRSHTKEQPFRCSHEGCDKAYFANSDLKQHARKHDPSLYIKCEFCDYKTPYNKDLRKHLRRHTGEKPYQCDFKLSDGLICLKSFVDSAGLIRHKRIHTDERPHPCSWSDCDYAGRTKYKLKVHMWF